MKRWYYIPVAVVVLVGGILPSCRQQPAGLQVQEIAHPFSYDLHFCMIPGSKESAMVCLHGMGGDYHIVEYVKQCSGISSTCFGFNFPDYGINTRAFDPEQTTFGSAKEILPALCVLKEVVVNQQFSSLSLYGFSAGGGAMINILVALYTEEYDAPLASVGVTKEDRQAILAALTKGVVLLDAPLKSVRELHAFRGPSPEVVVIEERFARNNMEPIDNIEKLQGIPVSFFVHFQKSDEVLSNRDDLLYMEKLLHLPVPTKVECVIGGESHSLPHPHLWQLYHLWAKTRS